MNEAVGYHHDRVQIYHKATTLKSDAVTRLRDNETSHQASHSPSENPAQVVRKSSLKKSLSTRSHTLHPACHLMRVERVEDGS